MAAGWLTAMACTLGVVLLSKAAVAVCATQLPPDCNLHSPSGHTGSAAAIDGSLASVLLPWPGRRWRALLYGLAAAVVRS